jgi:hypothetical protein
MANPIAACQCRLHQIPLPLPQPTELYFCHCTQCRHQSSSAFGTSATYPVEAFRPYIESAIHTEDVLGSEAQAPTSDPNVQKPRLACWSRNTQSGGILDCYFCMRCGSRLFHRRRGGESLRIKGGAIEPSDSLDWANASHIWTQEAVVAIPETAKQWKAEPDTV